MFVCGGLLRFVCGGLWLVGLWCVVFGGLVWFFGGLWLGGFVFALVFWAVCPPPVHPDGALPPRRRRAWSGRPLPGDATGVRTARRLPAVVVVAFFWPALAGMSCARVFLRAGFSSPAQVATYRSLPFGRVLGRVQHTSHLRVSLMGEPHVSYTRAFLSQSGGCMASNTLAPMPLWSRW